MYLFSRRRRINPARQRAAVEWSIARGAQATEISGLEVTPFTAVYSRALGTVIWSCFVPSLQALQEGGDKLAASDAFGDAIESGSDLFDGPVEDALFSIVHGTPEPGRRPEFVTSVRAVCRNGKLSEGLAVGVEIAQRAEKITGAQTIFATEASGTFGGVGWMTGFESIAALQAANEALMSDGSWLDFLDKDAGPAYLDAPTQTIFRRLG